MKHCLKTKHVDVVTVLCGRTVSNMFERTKRFAMFYQMFDVVQILSNTVKHDQTMCPNGKMFGHKTMLDRSRLDLAFSLLSVSVECK